MRPVLLSLSFLLTWLYSPAQYYLTGEVLDVHSDKLQNVSISAHSTGLIYQTGLAGEFRIPSRTIDDTLTFSVDGYQSYTTQVNSTGYLQVTLKMNSLLADEDEGRPLSLIRLPRWDTRLSEPASGTGAGAGTAAVGTSRGIGGGAPVGGSGGGPGVGQSSGPGVGRSDGPAGGREAAGTGAGTAKPMAVGAAKRQGRGGASGAGAATGGYSGRVENPFVPQVATLSFAGAVERESYNTIRRFLDMGSVVPADAVKIEEVLNYFNFTYDEPGAKDLFTCSSQVVACPWNPGHRILALRMCARKVDIHTRPPANLVLLIDASGSMDMPNKLPLLKAGVRLLVDNLRDIDTISVVEFGRQVRVLFAGMPGSEKARILRAIEGLRADGPSPGLEGLRLAYEVAKQQYIPRGNNRVILLTDGDVSMDPPAGEQDLADLVVKESQAGIRLTCGGLGMKSVKDSRLPALAEIGRGDFAYLDNEKVVEQLLAEELDPRLVSVANNVSFSVDFSPELVSEYRLIGYNNKRYVASDSSRSLVGARIGSGCSQVALVEVVPRYDSTGADTLARVTVNYCLPGQTAVRSMHFDCMNDFVPLERADEEWRRAICLVMFGMKLRESDYTGSVSWLDLEKMARKLFTGNNYLDDEYISLIDRAKRIYEKRGE